MKKYVWTPEKISIIKTFYSSYGGVWIKQNHLPDASIASIFYKAKSLGLKKLGRVKDKWTEEDLSYIKNAFDFSIQELCNILPKFKRDEITAKLRELGTKTNEDKFKCGVYIIGWGCKVYVGQTIHLNRRLSEHNRELRLDRHFNKRLQAVYNDIKEYPQLMEFVPCSEDDLLEVERWNIEIFSAKGFEVLNTIGNLNLKQPN